MHQIGAPAATGVSAVLRACWLRMAFLCPQQSVWLNHECVYLGENRRAGEALVTVEVTKGHGNGMEPQCLVSRAARPGIGSPLFWFTCSAGSSGFVEPPRNRLVHRGLGLANTYLYYNACLCACLAMQLLCYVTGE